MNDADTAHNRSRFIRMNGHDSDKQNAGQGPQIKPEPGQKWHRPVVAIMPLADTPGNPGSAHDGVGPATDTLC
jgi:hypothetical protein